MRRLVRLLALITEMSNKFEIRECWLYLFAQFELRMKVVYFV